MQTTTLDRRGIFWFIAISYGLAWLLALPLYFDPNGLNSPWASLILLMNFVPSIATLIVGKWISPERHLRSFTGLRLGIKGTGWGWMWLIALIGFVLFHVAAVFIGAAFGRFPLDMVNYSGVQAMAAEIPEFATLFESISIPTFVWLVILTLPLQALILTPFTFGEEWGWRGYLLPKLLPLGQWQALVLSGAIWGLWHMPLVLIGFNYPDQPVLGLLLMTVVGIIFGTLLGWTRLTSGSVFPAVLGHAAFNANQVLGGVFLLTSAEGVLDTTQASILGWTGWIAPLLVIGMLVALRRLPVQPLPEIEARG